MKKNMLACITLNSEYQGAHKFNGNKKIYVLVKDVNKFTKSSTIEKVLKEYLKDTILKDINNIEIIRDVNIVNSLSDYQYFVEGIKNIYDCDIERELEYPSMIYKIEEYKKFNVCIGTTQSLIKVVYARSWQQVKSILKKEGYEGEYILEQNSSHSFKITHINI